MRQPHAPGVPRQLSQPIPHGRGEGDLTGRGVGLRVDRGGRLRAHDLHRNDEAVRAVGLNERDGNIHRSLLSPDLVAVAGRSAITDHGCIVVPALDVGRSVLGTAPVKRATLHERRRSASGYAAGPSTNYIAEPAASGSRGSGPGAHCNTGQRRTEQPAAGGQRATTYDATVGKILLAGVEISQTSFILPPRGVVWVVSHEEFYLPKSITGLATLRTSWTHRGVLALNVGVVDPGYEGQLSTALVNFSESDFEVKVGEPFFRVLFFKHGAVQVSKTGHPPTEYHRKVLDYSRSYRRSFLNMESVASQVAQRVFGLPKWGTYLTLIALLVAVVAIFVPIAFSVWTDYRLLPARIEAMQRQIDDLKARNSDSDRVASIEKRLKLAKPQPSPTVAG